METEKLPEQLMLLAREYGLTLIEEPGFSGPSYRLMTRKDADTYMELVYGHKPPALH